MSHMLKGCVFSTGSTEGNILTNFLYNQ